MQVYMNCFASKQGLVNNFTARWMTVDQVLPCLKNRKNTSYGVRRLKEKR